MLASGSSDAAKVKAQCGQPGVNQSGGGSENYFIVHCPAAEGMRVANETYALHITDGLLQKGIEPPERGGNEQVTLPIHSEYLMLGGANAGWQTVRVERKLSFVVLFSLDLARFRGIPYCNNGS